MITGFVMATKLTLISEEIVRYLSNLIEMLVLPVTETEHSVLKIRKPFPSLLTLYPQFHYHKQYRSNLYKIYTNIYSFLQHKIFKENREKG